MKQGYSIQRLSKRSLCAHTTHHHWSQSTHTENQDNRPQHKSHLHNQHQCVVVPSLPMSMSFFGCAIVWGAVVVITISVTYIYIYCTIVMICRPPYVWGPYPNFWGFSGPMWAFSLEDLLRPVWYSAWGAYGEDHWKPHVSMNKLVFNGFHLFSMNVP